MLKRRLHEPCLVVALRKESVDRNFGVAIVVTSCVRSLSARRAWIEIKRDIPLLVTMESRSPQGERG